MTKLSQLFQNNFDCYADTWEYKGDKLVEGNVIMAMTEEKFEEIASEYAAQQNASLIEENKRLREALSTLRNGLFKDVNAVNEFIDTALSGTVEVQDEWFPIRIKSQDHPGKLVLENKRGDTFTSTSEKLNEELGDFLH